jgi:hypothetical protein
MASGLTDQERPLLLGSYLKLFDCDLARGLFIRRTHISNELCRRCLKADRLPLELTLTPRHALNMELFYRLLESGYGHLLPYERAPVGWSQHAKKETLTNCA